MDDDKAPPLREYSNARARQAKMIGMYPGDACDFQLKRYRRSIEEG